MASTMVREPAVAGMFYPGGARSLEQEVARHLREDTSHHDLLGCVAPHAGYMYSGPVAGRLYGHLRIPRRVVILGPNHTGLGSRVAVAPHLSWRTPLGPEPLDRELADLLLAEYPSAVPDELAHGREHSLEVQLPFIQVRRPGALVLPVVLQHLSLPECLELGAALARAIRRAGEPVGIVASSDMTHYEPDPVARERDRLAIDAALTLDPAELYDTVHANRISMCGVVPATVMLEAVRHLGVTGGHLVDYATSGDTGGDRSSVVGYAGLCFHGGV